MWLSFQCICKEHSYVTFILILFWILRGYVKKIFFMLLCFNLFFLLCHSSEGCLKFLNNFSFFFLYLFVSTCCFEAHYLTSRLKESSERRKNTTLQLSKNRWWPFSCLVESIFQVRLLSPREWMTVTLGPLSGSQVCSSPLNKEWLC